MAEHKLLSVSMEDVCQRPWAYAVEPFHIVDRLYYVGNSWVSVYLIDTGDGLLLIDTAMAQNVHLTLEGIRKLGFNPCHIRWILLSHAHYDHCGGAADIANYAHAEIYLGKEDMFFLTERQELIHACGTFQPFEVSKNYVDGEPMQFGEVTIVAKHCPGHTPGTYSFFFDMKENGRTYRCGMHGGLGVNTVTADYLTSHGLPLKYQQDFVNNLNAMKAEKVDIPLGSHTNHGGMLQKAARIGKGENPFIDPTGFAKVIDSRLEDFRFFCGDDKL